MKIQCYIWQSNELFIKDLFSAISYKTPGLTAYFKMDDERLYEYVKGTNNYGNYNYLTTYDTTLRANCPLGLSNDYGSFCRGKFLSA